MNLKGSELFLWVLIGLAIVASVLMMFSSSDAWQKIAVLAALWAAAVGAFLVMRMRGQATADSERMAELEDELDYQRAISEDERAKREEAIARSEEADETLAAIHEQLEAMRAQLEELTGRSYEYEPNSITASATRLREIGGSSTGSDAWTPEPEPEPEPEERPADVEVIPTTEDSYGSHTAAAVEDEPTWQWTPPEDSSYVEPAETRDEYHGRRRKEEEPEPFAFDFLGSYDAPEESGYHGRRRKDDREPTGGWTPTTPPEPEHEGRYTAQIPVVKEEPVTGGRRRADRSEGGVSVAELLKNLKK